MMSIEDKNYEWEVYVDNILLGRCQTNDRFKVIAEAKEKGIIDKSFDFTKARFHLVKKITNI